MDKELKNRVEAVLFASGRVVSLKELQQLTSSDPSHIRECVIDLTHEYEDRNSPIMIVEEADGWKLSVKERYLGVVHTINPHTELSRSILETLAVIAWKQPVFQADVIKVRTNKAYDHIAELEKLSFITKERHGRSFILRVSKKFMDYFDLPSDSSVKDLFKGFRDVEVAVQRKVDDFEKELPDADKIAMEHRTDDDIEYIASSSESESVGLETFHDELPPVNFPKSHDVHVYSDSSVSVSSDDEVDNSSKSESDVLPVSKSDDSSASDFIDESDDSSKKDSAPEKLDALSLAKKLLEEDKIEETKNKEDENLISSKGLSEDSFDSGLETAVDEKEGSADLSDDSDKADSGKSVTDTKSEIAEDNENNEDDEDDESDVEKPAEEFPGQLK